MNIPNVKSCLYGLLLFFVAGPVFAAPISWLPPDLAAVQVRAQREDKLFLLYFTADWCAPCQWMQDNTFQDAELLSHLHERVLSVKVDLNHAQAKELQHRFEVTSIPSFLVFATNGQLIDRRVGSQEAKPLLRWLKRQDKPAHHVEASLPPPTEAPALDAPRPQLAFSRPALIPDAVEESEPRLSLNAPSSSPALVLTGEPLATINPGFAPRSSLKYGVRLKVESVTYNTAIGMVTELERKYGQTVEMHPAQPGRFQLILGSFETTGEARQFLQFLQRNDRQGEVVPIN